MYFLLQWIQNLRKAEPVGPKRPDDSTLACSRWWEEGPTWGEPFYVQANGLSLQPGGLPRQFLRGLQITCHNPNIFLFLLSWSLISVVTLPWWATARVLKRLQESSNIWYKHDQHSLLFTWNDEIFRQLLISSRQLKNSVIIGINIQLMLPNIF